MMQEIEGFLKYEIKMDELDGFIFSFFNFSPLDH